MKQNLHTHSVYCDGRDAVDQMVQAAIEKGFTDLGFSSHGFNQPLDACSLDDVRQQAYLDAVLAAKQKFAGRIRVWLGVEEDAIGRNYADLGLDYIIGSVHFVPVPDGRWLAVDYDRETFDEILAAFGGDFLAFAKVYYEQVGMLADRPEVDIVGHMDLLMKYNEDEVYGRFEDPAYLDLALSAVRRLVAAGKIIEMNTGAMARGYRSRPYPDLPLLKEIQRLGGRILVNTDCHDCRFLDCGMDVAERLAKEAGFKTKTVLTKDGWKQEEW